MKDWHIAQLRVPGTNGGVVRRAAARLGPVVGGVLERAAAGENVAAGRWAKPALDVAGRLRRAASREVDPRRLASVGAHARHRARPDVLVVLERHREPHVASEPIDAPTAARRVAAHTELELLPALRAQAAFKYARPESGWEDVDRAPGRAGAMLSGATRALRSFVVRHPYPCSLAELDTEIERLTQAMG